MLDQIQLFDRGLNRLIIVVIQISKGALFSTTFHTSLKNSCPVHIWQSISCSFIFVNYFARSLLVRADNKQGMRVSFDRLELAKL